MNEYNFMTIHTLIDISKGDVPSLGEMYISGKTNVSRLIDIIMLYSPPFMTRVDSEMVNFDKARNCNFYRMRHLRGTGSHMVYTLKFAVNNVDVHMVSSIINGMPVIIPTKISTGILRRFITEETLEKNTSVIEDKLTTSRLS